MREKGTKTGLVLEGGAMRGLFTAGVMDVMMEAGVEFDGIVGVSAGSSFGCNYKSRQPGRVIRYNIRFRNDPRYMGLRTFLRTGDLVGADFAYHVMPMELDVFDSATFESNPAEFWLVTTDVTTGEPVYYRMDRVTHESLEWLRASASMPIVTRPVRVDDGRLMLDGGISDSIPLKFFDERGYDRNVVVLTQPRDFLKKPAAMWPFRLFMRRYPRIVEAMERRHEMYNAQLQYVASRAAAGKAFVIAPDRPLKIGRVEMNLRKMKNVYEAGRTACRRVLPALKEFLCES